MIANAFSSLFPFCFDHLFFGTVPFSLLSAGFVFIEVGDTKISRRGLDRKQLVFQYKDDLLFHQITVPCYQASDLRE